MLWYRVSDSVDVCLIQLNLSITTTSYDPSLSSRAHPGGTGPPGWGLEDRESDKIGNYLSSICINRFTKWKTGNRLHYKGGRYWQVLLYVYPISAADISFNLIKHLTVRSHNVSRRDLHLDSTDSCKIFKCLDNTARRSACHISKQFDEFIFQPRGFEILRDLMIFKQVPGALCKWHIRPKLILNLNVATSRKSITIVLSYVNFA